MFERNQQQGGRRTEDDPMRRMLFGGGARRSPIPQARPVMESAPPQTDAAYGNGPENGETPSVACLNACSLAMVYSPEQLWQNLFPVEQALREGTLFRELAKPFRGKTILGR